MKNLSYFAIPVFVVIFLLGGVFVWKMATPTSPVVNPETGELPNSVSSATGTKPSNPFSFLFGSGTTPIPTPTPASAAAMNADLASVGDDGGAADILGLQQTATGL